MLPRRDALDRDRLHLFVAGPGPGEGLALALPRPELGWIFVDGCKSNKNEYPLHEIWKDYRLDGEPTLGIVLTHPHKDHYEGMVRLIDLASPRWLACVATHHQARAEVRALRDDPVVQDYPGLLSGSVKDVLSRIQHEWDWNGTGRVLLRAGGSLPLGRTDVTIEVVAPDPDGTRAFFRDPDLAELLRARANELSAVLHVRFGATRLVLGGDLPERDHGAGPRTGWTKVLLSCPGLPGSLVLKIPHHGSDGARHPDMVKFGVAPGGACWVLTPFLGGRERPLPRFDRGRGVDALLDGINEVRLTSLPKGWTTKAPLDAVVPISAIEPPPAIAVPGARFKSLAGLTKGKPLDAVWVFAVDDKNRRTALHRGDRALTIGPRAVPAAKPPQPTSAPGRPRRR
jgi:hypothetical protein